MFLSKRNASHATWASAFTAVCFFGIFLTVPLSISMISHGVEDQCSRSRRFFYVFFGFQKRVFLLVLNGRVQKSLAEVVPSPSKSSMSDQIGLWKCVHFLKIQKNVTFYSLRSLVFAHVFSNTEVVNESCWSFGIKLLHQRNTIATRWPRPEMTIINVITNSWTLSLTVV